MQVHQVADVFDVLADTPAEVADLKGSPKPPRARQGAKPGHDPQGRLRRRCAVAPQALTVAAGLGREIASGRETYKGSAPPLASNGKRIRSGVRHRTGCV